MTREEKTFQAGIKFATKHPFKEFSKDRDSGRLMSYRQFADVFKYGCQDEWRRRGEL